MKGFLQKLNAATEAASGATVSAISDFRTKHGKFVKGALVATSGVVAAAASTGAFALAAPAAGSFAYDMYDIGVNQILNGAPGFIGGVCGIIWSATLINKNWIGAALGILACTAVLRADAITTSLGMVI